MQKKTSPNNSSTYKKEAIDDKIRSYVKEINSFSFARTIFSCQGHFCKNKIKSTLYYDETTNRRDEHLRDAAWSRFKNPSVLLEFSDSALAKRFVVVWTTLRTALSDYCWLHIVTPRNTSYIKTRLHALGNSIVVSRYDAVFVSVAIVFTSHFGSRYYKKKRGADKAVEKARRTLFDTTLRVLRLVARWLDKEKNRSLEQIA